MPTITSIGTGSGIDLEGLVTKIVDAERTPTATRLDLREARAQASISAYGNLKSTLDAFHTSLTAATKDGSGSTRQVTSSDEEIFTASAENDAIVGTHDIQVLNLASTHKLASGDFTSPSETLGNGTLTINVGTSSFSLIIEEGVNDQLNQVRDAINNATDNRGITASIITVDNGEEDGGTVSKLVLSANDSGSSKAISIDVIDSDGGNADNAGLSRLSFNPEEENGSQLQELSAAEDARITVDGFVARSSNNVFKSVIDGISITAVSEPEDPLSPPSATLTIEQNTASVKANVEKFVAGYNELSITLKALTGFNSTSQEAGLLNGDSGARQIDNLLRRSLSTQLSGTGNSFTSLASIGITTQRDGAIALDSDRLQAAIEQDLEGVNELLAGENGVLTRLASVTDDILSFDGIIKTRNNRFDTQLRDVADQREALDRRLGAIEARFRRQFSGLDTLISQLQSTGDFLSQQLESIAAITSGK